MNKLILFGFAGLLVIGGGLFYFYSSKVEVIKIVNSTPGFKVGVDQGIRNGIQLAFEQKNYQAGKYKLELVSEDDGDDEGNWTADKEREIATRAVNDEDVMVYLGPDNSGAAEISIPITNRAGLAQISPGTTWPGLTQSGFAPGEPGIYYPTGIRNFFRVVPTDASQGPAGAIWADTLGVKSVIIFDDGETYGKGIADLFDAKAKELGIIVVAHKTINPTSKDPIGDLGLTHLKADLVYFGGITTTGALPILKTVKTLGMAPKFMGADGIVDPPFLVQAGVDAEGVYATTVGVPVEELNGKGKQFFEDYLARFGAVPDPYAAFGYEAANISILAIERAGAKSRAKTLEAMRNIKGYDGIFGQWSFDENGDTTLGLITANRVMNGKFVFQEILPVSK